MNEWMTERSKAAGLVAWRCGIWASQAEKLIKRRLPPATVGGAMALEDKLELLADVVAELLDEDAQRGVSRREFARQSVQEKAESRAYAAYKADLARRAA
jgi:hypothetical protein